MSYGTDRAKSMKQDYLSLRKSEGLREESLRHMGHAVNRLFRFCEAKDLEPDELQKKHYTEWVNELRDSVSEATVNNYVMQVRTFVRWMETGSTERGSPYPETVAHLRLKNPFKLKRVREHADVTPELYVRIMEEARRLKPDLAVWLSILYDTGARRGEVIRLKLKDIISNGSSTMVLLKGKTGTRKVPLACSLPMVKSHIQMLPSDPDGYLFPGRFGKHRHASYFDAPRRKIEAILQNEGLIGEGEKLTNHTMRHARCTIYAARAGWSNPMLERVLGWSKGSKMPSLYSHPTDEDVIRNVAVAQGLAKPEKEQSEAQSCPNCEQPVPLAMRYCGQCGHAMQSEVQAEVDQVKGLVSELGAEMVEKLIQQGMAMEEFINSPEYQAIRQQFKVEAI